MKAVVLIIALLSCYTVDFAQSKLKLGQKVPDVALTILNNDKFSTKRISDFKGKLIILDYWSTWCSSCIEAMPKFEKLQKKFAADVVILPISFLQSKQVIRDFIRKRIGTEGEIGLPLAVFENTSNALFKALPTRGYPHEVWIDKNGNFLKNSESIDVSEDNIRAVLEGGKGKFTDKNQQIDFNVAKPLLIHNNGGPDTAYLFRSVITPYIDSISGTPVNNFGKSGNHLSWLNKTAVELVKVSLQNGHTIDPYNKYVVFEDSLLQQRLLPKKEERVMSKKWREQNCYCYDQVLPGNFTKEEAFSIMQQDIERFFKFKSSYERRMMDCVVLKRTDSLVRFAAKTTSPKVVVKIGRMILENVKMDYILSFMPYHEHNPILIDESGYTGKVDIAIDLPEQFDINFINHQLESYGLKFENVKRLLPVIVIREYNTSAFRAQN